MRLLTFQAAPGKPVRLGAVLDERWVLDLCATAAAQGGELASYTDSFVNAVTFLRSGAEGERRAKAILHRAVRETRAGGTGLAYCLPRDGVRYLPPVVAPGKVIASGRNFVAHLEEGNRDRRTRGQAEVGPSASPTAFVKLASTLVGQGALIPCPPETQELDYEGEVAAVVGRSAFRVPPADALSILAGFTIANDVSARDIQRQEMEHGLLCLGKNYPGFGPMGPELVTSDEVGDPGDLEIVTKVNGEVRQRASTADMRFGWADLIAYWSQLGLEPGDIILSGTPAGVAMGSSHGFLRPGDAVEVSVTGLGRLTNVVATVA